MFLWPNSLRDLAFYEICNISGTSPGHPIPPSCCEKRRLFRFSRQFSNTPTGHRGGGGGYPLCKVHTLSLFITGLRVENGLVFK